MPTWELREIRAQQRLRATELVDRDRERGVVDQRLAQLQDGREGGVLVIEGEAGIGKSALAAYAAGLAESAGTGVIVAVADAVERGTGYHAWRQTFAGILDVDEGAGEDELARHVVAIAGGDSDVLRELPLIASVLPVEIPDNEFTAALSGDLASGQHRAAADTVAPLANAPPRRPAGGGRGRAMAGHELVVAAACRRPGGPRHVDAGHDAAAYRWTLSSHECCRAISPSRAAAPREPVRARHRGARAPAAGRRGGPGRRWHASSRSASSGHPYFCEALVKAMQEGGIVRVENGRAVVADLEALDLPATVQGAVLSLVDRLNARQQLTLKVAAVAGRTFSVQAVVEVHPTGTETRSIEGDLETLLERDLLAPDDSEPEPAYTFRHQITREVAYGLLTPTQRRLLHRRVAEWYERTSSESELARNAALLAHHWKCAEEPKAVPYLETASERALRGGAFREAAHLYGQLTAQAGTATPDDVHRLALWEKGEAVAYYYLGDFELSRAGLERALAHLDRPVPRGGLGVTLGLGREVTRQLAHLSFPTRYRDRRSGERRLLLEAVDSYRMLALIDYVGGESTNELLYLFLAALNLGEEAGASPELASALATVAGVTSLFNLRSLTNRYVARARQLAEDEGQFQALAWIWNVQAVIEAQRGDWTSAVAASDRALELFGEVGDYNYEAEIWQTRAGIHICHGDFAGAEPCWMRTRELAARNSNAQLQGWSLLDEVQTQLGRGDTAAAGRALEAVLSIDDAPHDQHTEIEKHYCLAATRLAEGRREEALSAADHLLEVATARQLTGFWLADFAAGAVEVYVELLEQARTPEERRTLLRRARSGCRSLRRIAWTFHGVRPRRATLLGRVEWERGRRRRAARLWRRVESQAGRGGMDYELARARLELARHEVAGGDRKDMLDEAERTFDRLGAGRQLGTDQEAVMYVRAIDTTETPSGGNGAAATAAAAVDPAAFNPHDPAFLADPYPMYARLREHAPIRKVEPYGSWWVFRYEDCVQALEAQDVWVKNPPGGAPLARGSLRDDGELPGESVRRRPTLPRAPAGTARAGVRARDRRCRAARAGAGGAAARSRPRERRDRARLRLRAAAARTGPVRDHGHSGRRRGTTDVEGPDRLAGGDRGRARHHSARARARDGRDLLDGTQLVLRGDAARAGSGPAPGRGPVRGDLPRAAGRRLEHPAGPGLRQRLPRRRIPVHHLHHRLGRPRPAAAPGPAPEAAGEPGTARAPRSRRC